MRKTITLLAAGAAIIAVPALAQLGGVASGNVGADVTANPVGTVGNVAQDTTQRVGDTVDQVDDMANDTVDSAKLKLATREQVRAGANVSDADGNSIGTVQSIDGDNAVVVSGGKLYNIPLSELYSGATGALMTKLPKSALEAHAEAEADGDAR